MADEATLERAFLRLLVAAGLAGVLARIGLFAEIAGWACLALLMLAGVAVALLWRARGLVSLWASRNRGLAMGWLAAALFALLVWLAGLKSVQAALPAVKEGRRFWGAMHEFGLFFVAAFVLIAAAVAYAGTGERTEARRGPISRGLVSNVTSKIAAIPMALTAMVIFAGGTVWTVVYSFTDSKLLPRERWVGFDQYDRLWGTPRWLTSIENLLIYGVCTLIFSLVIGFILAALLDQKIRFENTFRTILLYPFALSFIVTGLVWQWILNPDYGIQSIVRGLGVSGFTFDPLYNPNIVIYGVLIAGLWQGTGLIMVLMLAGLRGIDQEIWKAARVDGIPAWKTYIFIIIPMLRPVFITTLVIIASGIVKVFDLVVAQTDGGPGISSEVPAKYVYDYMFQSQNLGQGFAASTMMLLAVAIIIIPWAYLEFGGRRRV